MPDLQSKLSITIDGGVTRVTVEHLPAFNVSRPQEYDIVCACKDDKGVSHEVQRKCSGTNSITCDCTDPKRPSITCGQ